MRAKYLLFLLAICLTLSLVSALDSDMCAEAVVTSINPSSVGANEDFTIGIEIDNCGEQIPENIVFEITRISPLISIKEPLITEVGELGYANSKRFILYHMRTSQNIPPGTYQIESELRYGTGTFFMKKTYNFAITVDTDLPELAISGTKTSPDRLGPKEDLILTLKVENSGEGSAKSVRVRLEGLNFEGVKEAYIGEIKPDEELPARFVLRAGEPGISNFNAKVFYQSTSEDKIEQFPLSLQVFSKQNYFWWAVPAIVLIAIVIIVFYSKSNHNNEDED